MAYHIQSSFAAGELDPAMHERTTFDKYQSGLATLRNAWIGKTGRIISRSGTLLMRQPKLSNRKCIIYSPLYSQYIVEWGHQYVRVHDTLGGSYTEGTHDFTESMLPNIQFIPSGEFLYVLCFGEKLKKLYLNPALSPFDPLRDALFLENADTGHEVFHSNGLEIDDVPVVLSKTVAGTGYAVDYRFTKVHNGQESQVSPIETGTLPINAGETNSFVVRVNLSGVEQNGSEPTEIRCYRRPNQGSAYGFVGSSNTFTTITPDEAFNFTFIDYGEDADYTHLPPTLDFTPVELDLSKGPIYAKGRTGCIYQQRLILSREENEEALNASRAGYQNNFLRDYPLTSDSALTFKCGTSGNAKVLWLMDNGGLLAFTTAGIYLNKGELSPDNLGFEKKGNWVIEVTVPPLEVPGGLLFVDRSTNTVRSLVFSEGDAGNTVVEGEELSIFSNHLFVNKNIVSWAFQDGDIPLVWVVLDDGSLVALTYQREHKMQAWGRHDSDNGVYESVTVLKDLENRSIVYFVVKRGENRYIEYLTPRFVSDLKEFVGMDAAVTYNLGINDAVGGATMNILPEDPEDWEGLLRITSSLGTWANTAGNGAAGTIFRFFDSEGSAVDLEVTTFVSTTEIIVQPSAEFPHSEAEDVYIYKTYLLSELTGLDHLDGKKVSVIVDGYVVSSPNNNIENYPEVTVMGGELSGYSEDVRGAFIHVGIPFTSDGETLDIDTVEQKPALLEAIQVHKVYMKVHNTRGLFVGSHFGDNDQVDGMTDPEERTEEIDVGNIGNAAQKPVTKRHEITIENDWNSKGRICWRQVDPLPYEILSVIPDLSVLR